MDGFGLEVVRGGSSGNVEDDDDEGLLMQHYASLGVDMYHSYGEVWLSVLALTASGCKRILVVFNVHSFAV